MMTPSSSWTARVCRSTSGYSMQPNAGAHGPTTKTQRDGNEPMPHEFTVILEMSSPIARSQ